MLQILLGLKHPTKISFNSEKTCAGDCAPVCEEIKKHCEKAADGYGMKPGSVLVTANVSVEFAAPD